MSYEVKLGEVEQRLQAEMETVNRAGLEDEIAERIRGEIFQEDGSIAEARTSLEGRFQVRQRSPLLSRRRPVFSSSVTAHRKRTRSHARRRLVGRQPPRAAA